VISVHLKSIWNMCHHAIKLMRGKRFGRIVNFSSDAFKGSVGQCNYAAATAGVIGLTRTIARECGRYGITANAMCPFAATRMTVNEAVIANWRRRVESGLLTQAEFEARMAMPGPEFVAPMVAYLCTDAAKGVNGQLFHAEKIALSHLPLWRGRALALQIREQRRVHSRRIDQTHSSFPAG
jgi:NAD(P)-dependent dehydrogenase (short-subunit alcohol dehydrogenase family)